LDAAGERPAVDQLKVEVGCTLEDRLASAVPGDHRKARHLHAVDRRPSAPDSSTGGRATATAPGFLLEPGDDVDGATAHDRRVRPVMPVDVERRPM
jgi:hypothetical protein